MKFATAAFLVAAPLSMARRVADIFSPQVIPRNDKSKLDARGITVIKGMRGAGISADSSSDTVIIWANPGDGASTTSINQQVKATQPATVGAGNGGGSSSTSISQGATATSPAKGASHTVKVGGPGGMLTYQPDQLNNIPVGDTVVFEFLAQNHTVTQSTFDTPCKAIVGGMDSGFLPNPNNAVSPPPQVAMLIMTSKPLWFYCAQKNHCGKGMVFSINPTAEKTHAKFMSMAIQQNGTASGTPITGGRQSGVPPIVEAPKQTPDAVRKGGTGVTPGTGTIGTDGSCNCHVACNAGAFPNAQAQGVGAFGGMGGALPIMSPMR